MDLSPEKSNLQEGKAIMHSSTYSNMHACVEVFFFFFFCFLRHCYVNMKFIHEILFDFQVPNYYREGYVRGRVVIV